jgi:hypothetical protein
MTTLSQSESRRAEAVPPVRAGTARITGRRLALILSEWLAIVALGLWFGAMIGIGALVAPVAFQLAREQAGAVLGESFQRLNTLGLGCAAVIAAATAVEWLAGSRSRWLLTRLALVAAAAGIVAYLTWSVFPSLELLRAAGATQKPAFDALHLHYEQMAHAQFALLLGAALATAVRATSSENVIRDA